VSYYSDDWLTILEGARDGMKGYTPTGRGVYRAPVGTSVSRRRCP
jgi:hypothetical protein